MAPLRIQGTVVDGEGRDGAVSLFPCSELGFDIKATSGDVHASRLQLVPGRHDLVNLKLAENIQLDGKSVIE